MIKTQQLLLNVRYRNTEKGKEGERKGEKERGLKKKCQKLLKTNLLRYIHESLKLSLRKRKLMF